jgi:glutathione S-transferase
MYTLYHQDGARSTAALLVLEEAGLDYELRDVDISSEEHRSPDFLTVNPRGLIPTLVTETGETVCETAAIMMYLADRHRLTELAPLPEEPGRGVLHDWLFYHVGEVQEAGKRGAYANRYTTNVGDVPRIRLKARETLFSRWQIVDRHLADNGPYHLGDRFSLIELYLLTTAAWLEVRAGGTEEWDGEYGISLDDLPAVKRCYELVAARPKCAPILERHINGVRSLLARSLPE